MAKYLQPQFQWSLPASYAVFFQWIYMPMILLRVPAKPMKPSSKLARPSVVAGRVRSLRSVMSCRRLAARSLLWQLAWETITEKEDG